MVIIVVFTPCGGSPKWPKRSVNTTVLNNFMCYCSLLHYCELSPGKHSFGQSMVLCSNCSKGLYVQYTSVCVYCMCRQELRRVQSSARDGHGQSHGPPLDPASLPSLPLHSLVFRAQTSTQISIHSLSVSSSMARGERRVRKDRKGQSVSDRRVS